MMGGRHSSTKRAAAAGGGIESRAGAPTVVLRRTIAPSSNHSRRQQHPPLRPTMSKTKSAPSLIADAPASPLPQRSTPIFARQKSTVSRKGTITNGGAGAPVPHPILPSARDIIQSCFDNAHADIGNRICMRVFEKRNDYQQMVYAMGKEKWPEMTNRLRDYLQSIVDQLCDYEQIIKLSKKYGEEHVDLKMYGFKPDYWVTLADAMSTECVYLDMAAHQPTDAVAAWSQLIGVMFSAIRDGYYDQLRAHRRHSRRLTRMKSSVDSSWSSEGNAADDQPPNRRNTTDGARNRMLSSVQRQQSTRSTPPPSSSARPSPSPVPIGD